MRRLVIGGLFAAVLVGAGALTASVATHGDDFQRQVLIDGVKQWELDLWAVAGLYVGLAVAGVVATFLFAVAFLGLGRR